MQPAGPYNPGNPLVLSPGSRLGPYEVVSLLGAGGMGQVYRATDTRLKRQVAIKILPPSFAADADRLARFQREAEVLASLNHPHIAGIYGLENTDGVQGLVMELVEGEDLSARIARGAIPLDEALPIARQIAEALEAAHEQGIIHRDLKPANIKLRPDGAVKVLDFGLAKAMDPAGTASVNATMSPTLSMHATQAGIILGTAAYMSPEQAAGKPVTKRSDLWSFGVVLFEMLTGRQVFTGETVSHVLAAVLRAEPHWTALPAETPPAIRRLLRRCLEKDHKRRLDSAADARLELDDAPLGQSSGESGVVAFAPGTMWRRAVPVVAAGLVMLAVGIAATWLVTRKSAIPPAVVRLTIPTRPGETVGVTAPDPDLALALDGRRLVYVVTTASGQTQLHARALDQLHSTPLLGSETTPARSPFLSPEAAWVGFFEGPALKKVAINGGPAQILCQVTATPRGASWGPHETVIFATSDSGTGLMEVPAAGGEPRVLTRPDGAKGEVDHIYPEILPGGEAVVFTIVTTGPIESSQVALLDLRSGQYRVLVSGGSNPRYAASGHLVYAVGGTLWAVAFDLDQRQVRGPAVPVVEDVVTKVTGAASFGLSRDGALVYLAGEPVAPGRTLVWVDRQGKEDPTWAPPRGYWVVRLSPDGARVALEIRDQGIDIWVWALAGQTLTRLTDDLTPSIDQLPVWTPDGEGVVYASGYPSALFWRKADAAGPAERLATAPVDMVGSSFSPDGTHLVVRQAHAKTGLDLYLLTFAGALGRNTTAAVRPLVATPHQEQNAEVSPDGAWIAYQSNELGTYEVYVRPFPDVNGSRTRVSTGGGAQPLWARNGRELFYRTPDGKVMTVPIRPGPGFIHGDAAVVVDRAYNRSVRGQGRTYDVSPDGQRFLMIKDLVTSPATPPQLVVVQNFFEELKRLVPAK